MEWVIRERPYRPRELDYSYLVEFTTKLHGISHGEKLFSRIPVEFKNELLYNNLVIACLDKGVIRLSLDYMKKNEGIMLSNLTLGFQPPYHFTLLTESQENDTKNTCSNEI